MRYKHPVVILFILICLYSCVPPNTKEETSGTSSVPISYSIVKRSPLFNERTSTFELNLYNNEICIALTFKNLDKFPFPVAERYKDTLSKTAFHFDLYCDGKIIPSDYNKIHKEDWYADSADRDDQLSILTDTIDLRTYGTINLQIPLYALHELKNGKHNIELHIYQKTFVDEVQDDSGYVNLSVNSRLFEARLKFELNVPPIYKTMIYGYGLVLRNDSTFSPAGMDNTIWNSSYPDIYWMLYYPQDKLYTKTDYEKSTDRYVTHDTFNLYHYYLNDSLGIGVFDHDNLSSDDCLGYNTWKMEALSRHKVARLRFDNVRSFDISLKNLGQINR